MKRVLLALVYLCLPSIAFSQPRPGSFTTLVTTDTSVTSACIGGNLPANPATCLGGLQAGPTVVNQAITIPTFIPGVTTNKLYSNAGTLFWNGSAVAVGGAVGPGTVGTIPIFSGVNSIGNSLGTEAGTVHTLAATFLSTVFGANSFTAGGVGDESLTVRNTTAGVANRGVLFLGNDASATLGTLAAHSSTFTTLGPAIANGVKLTASGAGGLSLQASDAAGILHFFTGTGTVERGQITAAGLFNWTTFGVHNFNAGGAGANALVVTNPTAGAANNAAIAMVSDAVTLSLNSYSSTFTTSGSAVQGGTSIASNGVGGISLAATHASGAVRIYTGSGTLRATYAASGSYSLGTTNRTDSVGVPVIASGFGGAANITGKDYAFEIGNATGTTGQVTFGTAYTVEPVCVASVNRFATPGTPIAINVSTTSTTLILTYSPALVAADTTWVLCRGF